MTLRVQVILFLRCIESWLSIVWESMGLVTRLEWQIGADIEFDERHRAELRLKREIAELKERVRRLEVVL